MFALWAKAAQVRSTCRCSLCASPANALARRASKGLTRRGLRQEDVFLVFSSTIAFEAAVIDSVRKDSRAKQWDKIIEEGKEKVEAVEADQKSRVRVLLDRTEERLVQDAGQQQQALYYPGTPWYRMGGIKLDWSWQGVFSWTAKQDKLRVATGFEDWKGPSLSLLTSLTAPELQELLTDKRVLRHFYGGPDCATLEAHPVRPQISTKKLRTLEWSVAKLVLRMLWTVCREDSYRYLTGVHTNYLTSVIPHEDALSFKHSWNDKLITANARLDQLTSLAPDSDTFDFFERPAIPSYDADIKALEDELIHLNTTLHATLQEMKAKDQLGSLMAKICQQLLLSRTPPNIHTYNLLLVRFCQLEELSLVHFVLESMWESHIRPNEITHAAVLRFFTVTGNKTEFLLYVKRMRGLKGGLTLANPDGPLSPLVVRSQVHFFGNGLRKIAEKARMNAEVYTALIIGMLRFLDPEDGMYWYRAMIDQGWRPTAELLVAILRQCCLRADWESGMAAWQQLSHEALHISVVAYEWMLRLCQRCQQHQVYSRVLHEGVRAGTLTARILKLQSEANSEDISSLLTQAQNNVVTQVDQKAIDAPLRKRLRQLRKFAATEGHHHLLDNILLRSPYPDQDLNKKVQALAKDVGKLQATRIGIARHEKIFNGLNAEIVATIDEVKTTLPNVEIQKSVLKFGLSANLPEIPVEDSPAIVLALYDHYKSDSTSNLQRESSLTIPPQPSSGLDANNPMQPQLKGFHELSDPAWSAEPHPIQNV